MRSEERLSGRSTVDTTCPARQSAEVGSGNPRTRDELRPVVTAVRGRKADRQPRRRGGSDFRRGRAVGRSHGLRSKRPRAVYRGYA